MDNVSLTATAANEANSTEATGLRVDGYDNAPMAIPAGVIFATSGWVRVNVTPRHDVEDMRDFGELTPYFFELVGVATYIRVYVSGVNTVQLRFDDGGGLHAAAWAAGGALVAGTTYLFEVQWDAAHMELRTDGIVRITIVQPVDFVADVPATWYAGTRDTDDYQIDATFNSV